MGVLDIFRTQERTERHLLQAQLDTATHRLEEAGELMSMNALFREDRGWTEIGHQGNELLTHDARRQAADLCRAMAILNPLIKRGLAIRAGYVWGTGLGVEARAKGENGTQDVNTVIQAFLDDDRNRRAFTGSQAQITNENLLGTDGYLFPVIFTDTRTGFCQVRTIDPAEMSDIITNPDDASEPWFYRRDYTRTVVGEHTGRARQQQVTEWHPDLSHRPTKRIPTINGDTVRWDAPVYRLRVNPVGQWGIGDAYAAIPWARGYKEFLEDWATLMKALSRIAWKISGKKSAAQAARAALSGLDAAGGVAAMDPATQLEAVPKTGATIDAESGRPLATMIAAALGLPVTTLLADPGQTGARAVAETLNQPTRLEFKNRRDVWQECYRAILNHVIDSAVRAPQGPLKGTETVGPFGRPTIELAGGTDRTLVFTWPPLDEEPTKELIDAIATADATGKVPPAETMRLLLRALGVRDVDEIVEEWTDENGNWIDPAVTAGDAAVAAFERGDDPAAAVRR